MPRRRPATVVSVLLACLGAVALLFGPGVIPGPTAGPRPLAAAHSVRAATNPHFPPRAKTPHRPVPDNASTNTTTPANAAPLADSVFTFAETPGAPRAFAVALDELYFPDRPLGQRLQSVSPAPDLAAHLARAAILGLASAAPVAPDDLRHSTAPRLVLYPVGEPRNATTRRIVTPGLVVTLASADAPTPAPAPQLGIVTWERPAYAPAQAIARIAGDPAQPLRALAALAATPGFASVRPLLAGELAPAHVLDALFFRDQWQLRNTGQRGGVKGRDIHAVPAWDTATGAGVTIGILDSSIDPWHRDLRERGRPDLAHDWLNGNPDEDSSHGTAVAGLAVAGGAYARTAGVAFDARFAALRLIGDAVTQEDIAEAFAWENDRIAIKNNSWGPPAGADELGTLDPLVFDALEDAVAHGRDGRGVLFVVATGNGREDGEQGSKSALAIARQSLAIGAINRKGAVAAFSEDGPHLLAVAPGVDVLTTDVTGDGGYVDGSDYDPQDDRDPADYVFFTGTSAATPVASGVCALLLQARPDLGWRDVKEIILRSSTKLSPADKGWTQRAGNRPALPPIHHHARLGAGLLNAQAALQLAAAWPVLPPEESLVAPPPATPLPVAIPDAGKKSPVQLAFVVPAGQPFRIEHVSLTLGITHPARGDLDIQLRSPAGVVSRFATATFADSGSDYPGWTFTSVRHWGELAAGTWTLTVTDAYRDDVGTLDSANLVFHGITPAAPLLPPELPQPADGTFTTGSSFWTQVNAEGLDLTYTWYRNDKKIASGRSPEFRVKALSVRDAGIYRCVVSNPWGSVATSDFTVVIDDTPLATFVTHAGVVQEISLAGVLNNGGPWKIAGLPPGLRFNPQTMTITGTMSKAGAWNTSFTITYEGQTIRQYIRFESASRYPQYAGNFTGWMSGLPPAYNQGLGGLVSITLREDGRFTGRLLYGDLVYPLSGQLKNTTSEGEQAATITLPAKKPLPALRLGISSSAEDYMEITLRAPGPEDGGIAFAYRDRWSASNPATLYAGSYRFATSAPGNTLADGTQNSLVTIKSNGVAEWTLFASDGAVLRRGSSRLDARGFVALYTTTTAPRGAIFGDFYLLPIRSEANPPPSMISWTPAASLANPPAGMSLDFYGSLESEP